MPTWKNASGPLPYPVTNDYLFRVLLQKSEAVLRSLICSVFEISETDITSIHITNPIILGEAIDEKDYILDVNVLLNNKISVNFEMQVINYGDWPERSLQYLCRNFDFLNKGEDYINSRTAIHIGILDFQLFEETEPEFFSSYKLMNTKSHRVYSDKLQLFTLALPFIDHATETDKQFHRDMWGYFFKAETWEDLKIMENNYPIIGEAASIVYNAVNDKAIRDRIEARADYERRQRTLQRQITSQKEIIASQKEEINSQKEEIASQKEKLASQKEELASQKEKLASQKEELASQKEELASQEGEISVLQEQISDRDKIIAELKNQIKILQS